MKVQCEVCTAEAASVFCCADEAALCDSCDRRVHGANRLAGKHRRFSLLYPSSSAQTPPLCDVCKEKTGFLFCQEDRAILCRDCDLPIHSTSALTMKHSRFLLTGVRLSAAPKLEVEAVTSMHGQCNIKTDSNDSGEGGSMVATTNSSSISEYLMNMLPGWHVDDFLMDDVTAQAFCKTEAKEEEVKPFNVMDTSNSVLNGYDAPCWVAGGEGTGVEEVEMEMEMEASAGVKRPRISIRYL
ncbi:hypothetical protein OPV22_001638 [Ensete ventricosum]|uniref:B box-type domain-containing protein n=1 Tax=Ensete ventricosum TaxID=4639 RepID=A0AAV8RLP8_ENSVE|nr:hypothetical protein OPV22_001638 [Ensete ventricosum]